MSPEERDQLIQRYYDGETIGNESAQAREILEKDPEARALIEQLQSLSDKIKVEIQEAVAEEDFSTYWASIQSRLPQGPPTGEVETVPDEDQGLLEEPAIPSDRPDVIVHNPSTLEPPRRSWLPWLLGPALGAAVATVVVLVVTGGETDSVAPSPVALEQAEMQGAEAVEARRVVTASRAMTAPSSDRTERGAHSIEIESVESDGPLVMVLQESPEEPAIIWFIETGDAT